MGAAGLPSRTAWATSSACGSAAGAGDGRWVPCSWQACWTGPPSRLDRVRLDVVDGNAPARRLYERMGFVATGVVTAYENAPGGTESEMVRLL